MEGLDQEGNQAKEVYQANQDQPGNQVLLVHLGNLATQVKEENQVYQGIQVKEDCQELMEGQVRSLLNVIPYTYHLFHDMLLGLDI